jgi:hypothetical protein
MEPSNYPTNTLAGSQFPFFAPGDVRIFPTNLPAVNRYYIEDSVNFLAAATVKCCIVPPHLL